MNQSIVFNFSKFMCQTCIWSTNEIICDKCSSLMCAICLSIYI